MSETVVVKELTKHYGNIIAVDKVTFHVYEGEIFSLVGPNGAGKTTTVEILECLRRPTSGLAMVLGFDVVKEEEKIKRRIGVMPQDFNAFERLTVLENVELIARIYGVKPNLQSLLEELGLWHVRKRRFMELSGGMKRRVGICMALVNDPELLFLDEPTTGLDPQGRKECWDVIRKLKKMGKTVFLTTHYMEEVEKLSDRAAIIVNGKIKAIDKVDELINTHGGGVKVCVKGGSEVERLMRNLTRNFRHEEEGRIVGVFSNKQEALKAVLQLYNLNEECRVEVIEPNMNDVFLRLVGGRIDERGELV